MTLISLAIDYSLGGFDAALYHIHNLVLHLLNAFLVYVFIRKISDNITIAFITALLFGIHPMHVESVAWISERKDVLYSFYYLLALVFYMNYLKSPSNKLRYYLATLTCFILSLFAKGMAVTLPVILIAIDYLLRHKNWRQNLFEKIPFFLLSIVFGIILIKTQQAGQAMFELSELQWYKSIFVGAYGMMVYLIKCILPYNLCAFHPYPYTSGGDMPWYIYAAILPGIALFFFTIKSMKRNRDYAFGFLFFLISIAPVLQIIPAGKAIISDRFTYLSYIGIFYIISFIWVNYFAKQTKTGFTRQIIKTVAILYIVSLVFISHQRTKVWKNNITLWSDVIKKYPDHRLAYCNRASSYYESGKFDSALLDCNQCIRINPDLHESYNNRGLANLASSNNQTALEDFSRAIEIYPDYQRAIGNRAVLLMRLNQDSLAMVDFSKLIELNSEDVLSYYNMSILLQKLGNFTEALQYINRAIDLSNDEGSFYYFRSIIHKALNENKKALDDIKISQELGFIIEN